MPVDSLDLGAVVKAGQLTVTPEEHPDDRAARLRREERASFIEECKGVVVFAAILIGITIIAALSAYKGLLDPTASPEVQRWGQGVLTVVMSSAISFFVGKKVGR